VIAGTLLTGGGTLAADRTLNVDEASIDHDALTNFAANEHFLKTEVGLDDLDDCGTLTGALLQDALMFGSGNLAWVPCVSIGNEDGNYLMYQRAYCLAAGSGASLWYQLPLPTAMGALKLYVDDMKIAVLDADANDYIDHVYIHGVNTSSTSLYDDATNQTSTGDKTYSTDALDCSSYDAIIVQVKIATNADGELEFYPPRLGCYYTT
jgi:hypothetical protein